MEGDKRLSRLFSGNLPAENCDASNFSVFLWSFPSQRPPSPQNYSPLYCMFTMFAEGAIGYLSTKVGALNGKDPFFFIRFDSYRISFNRKVVDKNQSYLMI